MAFLLSHVRQGLVKRMTVVRFSSSAAQDNHPDKPDVSLENPYLEEKQQCILCKYGIELDYKVSLLIFVMLVMPILMYL